MIDPKPLYPIANAVTGESVGFITESTIHIVRELQGRMSQLGFTTKESAPISLVLAMCIIRGQRELMRALESGDPDSILKDIRAVRGWTKPCLKPAP